MKKDIHPKYGEATISCACGEVIHTRSTKKEIKVGVCSKCHPFFTGTQKYVDTAGRVEKFLKKYAGIKPAKKKVRTRKGETTVPVAADNAVPAGAATEAKTTPVEAAAEKPVQETSPAPIEAAVEASAKEESPAPAEEVTPETSAPAEAPAKEETAAPVEAAPEEPPAPVEAAPEAPAKEETAAPEETPAEEAPPAAPDAEAKE